MGKGSINRVNKLSSTKLVNNNIKTELADNRNLIDISILKKVPAEWIFYTSSRVNLEALKESISKFGILEPVTIRILKDGSFELLSGYLRVEACRQLGISKIKCSILECISDESAFEIYMELHKDKIKNSKFHETKFNTISMLKNDLPDYLL